MDSSVWLRNLDVRVFVLLSLCCSSLFAQSGTENPHREQHTSEPIFYRITRESQTREALDEERNIETLLGNLGKGESDTVSLNAVGHPTDVFLIAVRSRRLAKLMEMLDSIEPLEAKSLILEYAKQNLKTVEHNALKEVAFSIEINSLPFEQRGKRNDELFANRGDTNWRAANYYMAILLGRYAPDSLLKYEAEILKSIEPAIVAATAVKPGMHRDSLLSEIFRKACPKLLWINIYRLALSRKGVPIPDNDIFQNMVRNETMYKWSALPELPEVGSLNEGRTYAEADVLEVFSVIPTWPMRSEKFSEDIYLAELREAMGHR